MQGNERNNRTYMALLPLIMTFSVFFCHSCAESSLLSIEGAQCQYAQRLMMQQSSGRQSVCAYTQWQNLFAINEKTMNSSATKPYKAAYGEVKDDGILLCECMHIFNDKLTFVVSISGSNFVWTISFGPKKQSCTRRVPLFHYVDAVVWLKKVYIAIWVKRWNDNTIWNGLMKH